MSQPDSPDTREVARSYFEQLINKHDLPFVDQLFDPNIAFYDPAIPGGQALGLDQVRNFFRTFFIAFPDVNFQMNDFFAEGGSAAIRFTWTGTHRATWLGITLSERHVTVPGIDIFH
ncbi:MAG TPA: ester cyclase, partial [Herpetosiphonaceae bacterium]|nr:ester cyclase [Herpetosiphonaceae bacterium]